MTTGPVRTSAVKKHIQPPRPPNAWILYRSEKIRTLPPPQPGEARRAQADVSRMISEMWKSEAEEERARYERMAEQKKAEHQQKYPGYRFQPQKKEEKQRMREMIKQERQNNREARKNRGRLEVTPTPTPTLGVPAPPYFNAPFYSPETQYGPAGPSPPMSAAPSPRIDNASSPASDEPTPQAVPNASQQPNNGQQQSPPILVPFVFPESQLQPTQWASQPSIAQPTTETTMEWSHQSLPMVDNVPTEFISFDIQSLPTSTTEPWLNSDPSDGLVEALQAFLSSTADPSIFHLNNIDVDLLTSNPPGEIEVSMGQVPLAFENILSQTIPDLPTFDFTSMAGPSSQPLDLLSSSSNDNPALLSQSLRLSSGSSDNTAYNAEEFLNFDETSMNTFPSIPIPPTTEMTQEITTNHTPTPCSSAYIPPTGAAYSSTRRVGATWKPPTSFIDVDTTMDHSPPRAWGVPAN